MSNLIDKQKIYTLLYESDCQRPLTICQNHTHVYNYIDIHTDLTKCVLDQKEKHYLITKPEATNIHNALMPGFLSVSVIVNVCIIFSKSNSMNYKLF